MIKAWQESAGSLARMVRTGELRALDVADAHIERALAWNDRVGALLHFEPEDVRRQARHIDRLVAAGQDPGLLAGVPVALKDNICVRDVATTCGSAILEPFEPPYDAHVVERLREAGAVLFAKTNMDEFGMGSSTEYSAYGPSRNPHALDRTPGGSSGGSAAAVACGMVPLALGSDTGGSIRQPAAFCGIVGVKPTYGLVSRFGLIAFASSLDQIGPMARDVDDAALLLRAISGHDPRDATSSVRHLAPTEAEESSSLRGLRVGLPREFFEAGVDPAVRAAVGSAQAVLHRAGAQTEEVSLPLSRFAIPVYYVVAPSEASSNLARFDGIRVGNRADSTGGVQEMMAATRGEFFGPEVKRRILLGTYSLSTGYSQAYYRRAQRMRAAIRREMEELFEQVDVLLAPTTPTVAFPLGEKTEDPLAMYQSDVLTVAANLCGIPALSMPCGRSAEGLPIGMQLMAARFREDLLFKVARACEEFGAGRFRWPQEPSQ